MSKSMLTRDLPSYRRQGSGKRLVRNTISVLVLVFLILTLVQGLFLKSVKIQSDSMQPGIMPGDLVLASPLLYGKESFFTGTTVLDFSRPSRGDVVLIEPPYHAESGFVQRVASHLASFFSLGRWQPHFGKSGEKSWEQSFVVRRVIAVPGDQIYGNDGIFFIKVKGKSDFQTEFTASGKRYGVMQPAVQIRNPDMVFSAEMPLLTVPADMYFMGADNRTHGLDSRHWGLVPITAFRGQLLLDYWPLRSFGQIR